MGVYTRLVQSYSDKKISVIMLFSWFSIFSILLLTQVEMRPQSGQQPSISLGNLSPGKPTSQIPLGNGFSIGKIPNNKHFGINAGTGNWKFGVGTNKNLGFGAGASFSTGNWKFGAGGGDGNFRASVGLGLGAPKEHFKEALF